MRFAKIQVTEVHRFQARDKLPDGFRQVVLRLMIRREASEEREVNPYCFVRAVKALRVEKRRSESYDCAGVARR